LVLEEVVKEEGGRNMRRFGGGKADASWQGTMLSFQASFLLLWGSRASRDRAGR